MIIHIDDRDRFLFQSAVDTQGIQFIVNNLNSRLVYFDDQNLGLSILGPGLLNHIPMGTGGRFPLPYSFVRFEIPVANLVGTTFTAESIPGGTKVVITANDRDFIPPRLILEFDEYLTLRRLNLNFGLTDKRIDARCTLMSAAFSHLPTILGYMVHVGTRQRTDFTLGDPRQYSSHGSSEESVQHIGDVKVITNPRDNPTGIAKRPHERAGHYRQNADGTRTWIAPTVVHPDDYEPSDRPKKLR